MFKKNKKRKNKKRISKTQKSLSTKGFTEEMKCNFQRIKIKLKSKKRKNKFLKNIKTPSKNKK